MGIWRTFDMYSLECDENNEEIGVENRPSHYSDDDASETKKNRLDDLKVNSEYFIHLMMTDGSS
jgi:hypothetical protein